MVVYVWNGDYDGVWSGDYGGVCMVVFVCRKLILFYFLSQHVTS